MFDRITTPEPDAQDTPGILIELPGERKVEETPDGIIVTMEDGSVEICPAEDEIPEAAHHDNLAESIPEDELRRLGLELLQNVEYDLQSRAEWEDTIVSRLPLLGFKMEKRNDPWPGACSLQHTMIAEALVRFQSNLMAEIFPADGPVRTVVIGDVTNEKQEQAEREREYLNYLLTEEIEDYRSETERLAFGLGIFGAAFRKVYRDPVLERPAAQYVPAQDFILPYGATSLFAAERYTHRMRLPKNDVRKLQAVGTYRKTLVDDSMEVGNELQSRIDELGQLQPSLAVSDSAVVYESHCNLDLKGFESEDGVALPYVVTFDESGNILAIYRNWDESDTKRRKLLWFAQYTYIPGFGPYGYGLLHLIGGSSQAATSIQRQLIDAGTLANLPGGFRTRSLKVKGDDSPHRPGEWRDVDAPQGRIADSFFPLPYKEPSQTLLALLTNLVEEGRRLGSIADTDVGDVNSQAPVGTTLAIMEKAMKVMSAIQARCHASMRAEFRILVRVIKDSLIEDYPYDVSGASRRILKSDFDGRVAVIPVSDPNAATLSQRITLYQMAVQLSQMAPQLYDLAALHRQMLKVAGIKDVDLILPDKSKIVPMDPVSENMAIVTGKPVKAFEWQEHEAHIQSHMAFVQDPQTAAILGQNPQANAIFAAAMSHAAEHLAYLYRGQIEQELGVPLPALGQPLPGDVESNLSVAVAAASAKLQGKHQSDQAQKQAAAAAADPMVQMQQAELQLKAQQLQAKAAVDAQKVQVEAARVTNSAAVERERIASQERMAQQAAVDRGEQFLAEHRLNAPKEEAEIEKLKAQVAELLARVDRMTGGVQ